ncbi:MAG: signal peptide peptidase SppA [Anaerolineae bacterium]|nr:signal peptide peptidase SppA [Phycisphaerae bacterium]
MSSRTTVALIVCACMLVTMPTSQAMSAPTSQPTTQKVRDQLSELTKRVEKMANDEENALSRAKKSSKPAPDPKTAPLADATSDESPTTNPTTSPTAQVKIPTPAELFEKIKKAKADKAALLKVAYFDLDGPVSEKPSDFSLFNPEGGLTLHKLLERINKARDDKDVRAVLVTLGAESSMGLAQAQEVRDAFKDVVRAGKKVFVYADSYDTVAYTIASSATDVCLLQGGEIMIPGIGFETMFYKGTMDKVGVQADYIQIGEYKGAEEPYTRTEPSDELRGELTKLTEAIYDQMVDGISLSRNVSRQAVQQLIDDTMLSAAGAKDRGFIDHIVDQDGLRALIKDELGGEIDLLADYGAPAKEEIDFSNPFLVLASLAKKPEPSNKPTIAIIYAEGVITDGSGEGSLLGGGGVGSDPMRRAFRTALRDDNVKAIVLRIDSPGGSALASEVMWQSARRLAAKKPLIVSIGGMAASGGYYLASAGDYIFADPSGIVGSIGVVGGKFVTKDLFAKLGLNTENFSKGRNAGLFSSNEPWSDRQRRMVRAWMQQTYDQFTQRIMTTRSGKIGDIDKVARGRIFLARDAKELGMIDELGGTLAAIEYAAKKVDLEPGSYEVRTVPGPRTLADFFGGSSESDAAFTFKPTMNINVGADSVLNALAPDLRRSLTQQVQMLQLLQQRPVVLMSPFIVKSR